MTEHRATIELPPHPTAARKARLFVLETCKTWGLGAELDTLVLLTSELVTNGVLHARTPLTVSMRADDNGIAVEVQDADPRPPAPRSHRENLLADIDELLSRREETLAVTDERQAVLAVGPAGAIGAGRGLLLVEALADEWGVELHAVGKSVWFVLTSG